MSSSLSEKQRVFLDLWTTALDKYKEKTGSSLTDDHGDLGRRLDQCRSREDVLAVLSSQVQQFEQNRSKHARWETMKKKLYPIIDVVLVFNDAVAELAASLVRTVCCIASTD